MPPPTPSPSPPPVPATRWTESGKRCVIPFTYEGVTYYDCTDVENKGVFWCSLVGNWSKGQPWENCGEGAPPPPSPPPPWTGFQGRVWGDGPMGGCHVVFDKANDGKVSGNNGVEYNVTKIWNHLIDLETTGTIMGAYDLRPNTWHYTGAVVVPLLPRVNGAIGGGNARDHYRDGFNVTDALCDPFKVVNLTNGTSGTDPTCGATPWWDISAGAGNNGGGDGVRATTSRVSGGDAYGATGCVDVFSGLAQSFTYRARVDGVAVNTVQVSPLTTLVATAMDLFNTDAATTMARAAAALDVDLADFSLSEAGRCFTCTALDSLVLVPTLTL